MAGNARFESPSVSSSEPVFSGTYSNGKRGAHSVGPNLDRSGSFREGAESRVFSSGIAGSRGGSNAMVASGNLPPLSQCLSLEPIPMVERKIDRSVELKRVMELFVGSTTEDTSSGAANLKTSPQVAVTEDLKRLRSSVVDTCVMARGRASKLDEHLHKLDKYCDGVIAKKLQRNELMNNDQAGSLNSKNGTQSYRNPTELVNQRVEDRPKNVLLNKRVRTSVAERVELRSNGLRRQPVAMAKDRDLLKDNGGESDMLEEKIQRLPAGGEGWDKKMKRKRSVGTVFTRPMDSNGEPKRTVQNKVVSEPGLQSSDTQPYRLGSSNGTGGTHKADDKVEGTSLPNSSRARLSPRNDLEGPCLPRDLTAGSNKERIVMKGNNKLNTRDDNYTACGSPVPKGRASRTPRNSAMVAASPSPSTPRPSGTPEAWENVTLTSKIPSTSGVSNRKRAMPSASSPSMAQWAGQRPQKMSRMRRANLVSPVSNPEEKQQSSDSCSHSDVSVRLASDGTNVPLISKNATNCPQPQLLKPKAEHVQSPHRLSESEESVGGESRLKDKGKGNGDADANVHNGQNVGPSLSPGMKLKPVNNEEIGDGVRRQGRSGRGPLIARASTALNGEKSDNATTLKQIRSNRPGSEKNGSKSGRPLKKLSERKGFSRLGHLQNGGSDCTVKNDDDREELLAAANHGRNASYLACSNPFWKKMEPVFAPVSSKDRLYLSLQLKEDILEPMCGRENNVVVNLPHEASEYNAHASAERHGHVKHQGGESFSGRLDSDKTPKEFIPLFQRVLSALIIEDTIDELEEDPTSIPLQDAFCDSTYDTFHLDDYEPRKRARREIECDNIYGVHAKSPHSVKMSFSIDGCANDFRSPSINDSPCEDVETLSGISKNFLDRSQVLQMEGFHISSYDSQYEQMRLDDKLLFELQSIGLYPELVPNLDDKEDETIKNEINQLKSKLQQQNGKKKACLEKICKGIGSSVVGRDLEQVAMDRLVELAHRKLLGTRGASRAGITKVPKHVALAFVRRTLAKCRKFAKSGVSCFNVPPLRDILFAPPEIELESQVATTTTTKYIQFQNPHPDSRISSDEAFAMHGPTSNRGKKKELLLDDVGTTLGGRPFQGGDRKTKPKPKQKAAAVAAPAAQPPSSRTLHPVQPSLYRTSKLLDNGGDKKRDPMDDLDPIDELGGPQDLSSLLNFDEEELQDHFSAGLDIPMDDLSELMF